MPRKPLSPAQAAELARIRAQNAGWEVRPRGQHVRIALAWVLVAWAITAGITWFFETQIGLSPAGVVVASFMAALAAAIGCLLTVMPAGLQEWSVRQSVPREEDLEGPWGAWGDIRAQDFPKRRSASRHEDTPDDS